MGSNYVAKGSKPRCAVMGRVVIYIGSPRKGTRDGVRPHKLVLEASLSRKRFGLSFLGFLAVNSKVNV